MDEQTNPEEQQEQPASEEAEEQRAWSFAAYEKCPECEGAVAIYVDQRGYRLGHCEMCGMFHHPHFGWYMPPEP